MPLKGFASQGELDAGPQDPESFLEVLGDLAFSCCLGFSSWTFLVLGRDGI